MAGPNSAERGIPQQPEIKPFSELSPEEIQQRTGGVLITGQDGLRRLKNSTVGSEIEFNKPSNEPTRKYSVLHVYQGSGGSSHHALDRTVAVLESESITFVYPKHKFSISGGAEVQKMKMVKISKEEYTATNMLLSAERPMDPNLTHIHKAATLARELDDIRWRQELQSQQERLKKV